MNNDKTCGVENCDQKRYSTSGYCKPHHASYMARLKAKKADAKKASRKSDRPPVMNPVFSPLDAIVADFPRLLVIDTQTRICIEYAPVRHYVAVSQKSLEATRQLLSSRPNWIVAMEDDNG